VNDRRFSSVGQRPEDFSTASEQAVENSLLHVRDDVPDAQRP